MPAEPALVRPSVGQPDVISELRVLRAQLRDPDGVDPAQSLPLSPEDDAVEICGAVYALPEPFREVHRSGLPLLWPWPSDLYLGELSRRDELLLAAAYLIAAVERIDGAVNPGTAPNDAADRRVRRSRGTLSARLGWGRLGADAALQVIDGEGGGS